MKNKVPYKGSIGDVERGYFIFFDSGIIYYDPDDDQRDENPGCHMWSVAFGPEVTNAISEGDFEEASPLEFLVITGKSVDEAIRMFEELSK